MTLLSGRKSSHANREEFLISSVSEVNRPIINKINLFSENSPDKITNSLKYELITQTIKVYPLDKNILILNETNRKLNQWILINI